MGDPCGDGSCFRQLQPETDAAAGIVRVQGGLDPQILGDGLGIEVNGTENAGEPEEILVLDPAAAAALVDLDAEPVAGFSDPGGQVEVRGGEGILAVAYKVTVQPDEGCLLDALEGHADTLTLQPILQIEFLHIAAHGIPFPVQHGGTQLRVAVPGIELIGVVDGIKALGLHVAGNLDCGKAGQIVALLPEVDGAGIGIFAPPEDPLAVQGLPQRGFACLGFLHRGVAYMVGMGIQPVDPEYSGVFQPLDIRNHNRSSCLWYFTSLLSFSIPKLGKLVNKNAVSFPNSLTIRQNMLS